MPFSPDIDTLFLPENAGQGQAGWVFTADPSIIPAELITKYGLGGSGIRAVMIAYDNFGDYQYQAVLGSGAVAVGWWDIFDQVVVESYQSDFTSSGFVQARIQYGSLAAPSDRTIVNFGLKGDLQFDDVSHGRGIRYHASSDANSANIGAETVLLSTGNSTWYNGRVYRVRMRARISASVIDAVARVRVRKTNAAGTLLHFGQEIRTGSGTAETYYDEFYFKNSSGADVSAVICMTLEASAGTVQAAGATADQHYMIIEDAGSTDDYNANLAGL